MYVERRCDRCRLLRYECKCTPAELDRFSKENELESLRAQVAQLEIELGVPHVSGGNRKQRRTNAARARKFR